MNRITHEVITSDRFESEVVDFARISTAFTKARISFARMRFHLRFLFAARQPPWLGDVDWAWPSWRESPRPFDYKRECLADFTRQFPPIVGGGRGVVMNTAVSLRDTVLWLQGRDGEVDPKALRILNAGQARRYPVER